MLRNIDVDLLRSFVTIAELRNFTRAAAALFRSQSTVSAQIRRLEELTGQSLLQRSPHDVSLTHAGEQFLGYARRIVALHDEALDVINARQVSGRVRLAVMDDYATLVLPEILARFARSHPDVELEVTTGFTRDLLNGLGEEFDLVLATQKAGDGRGTVLRQEPTSWACADEVSFVLDAPLPLALLKPPNMFREWALAALDEAGLRWRILFSSTSIGAVEAVAASGAALTVVKQGTARAGLRLLGQEEGLPLLPASEIALHLTPGRVSAAIGALAAFLGDALREKRGGAP
ncbi:MULTISPECIES: LysR family transcriptional regulator [unclassified Bosea (in: a-proteobacteria)]|uniref:LysR family transcriptional regulator n=1 Tax=unclassified Bosea (in: a-proteobacteria) TaxID=2653178 RepID=UPI000955074C|nr:MULTISPECIES: LysR family transcriptional regulator [unclassified Bosea (in: a-proteobacteria)]TAJ29486.1 MAG: LysR family transcriptional regulator [Bosea sp. (in: a-proteobacteria)]SIR58914.1 DNA-binding transcriptional regulator, LysR family [Bosea sp. TND4EK4]